MLGRDLVARWSSKLRRDIRRQHRPRARRRGAKLGSRHVRPLEQTRRGARNLVESWSPNPQPAHRQGNGDKHMKTRYSVLLAMAVGFGLGAVAVQGLHAQAKPPVYYIGEIDVTNADAYAKEYQPGAGALIKAAGGRSPAAGKAIPIEGAPPKMSASSCWPGTAWKPCRPGAIPRPSRTEGRSARNMRASAPSPSRACRNSDGNGANTARRREHPQFATPLRNARRIKRLNPGQYWER